MPLLKKKIYNLTPSPRDLKAGEELFVVPETKECFRSYDEYIAKVFLYSSQHWSCQYTGLSGLTYNAALSSEGKALKRLKSFPDCLKDSVLRTIHKGEGTVKEVVGKCWKFLATHYCPQEEVVILSTKNGKKSIGVVIEVLNSSKEANVDSPLCDKENEGQHTAGTKVEKWNYSVQLEGSDVVLTDILTDQIKRKTKLPSKELIKLFIKSSAERSSVDGKDMWLVKDDLIQKYDLGLPAVSKSSTELKEAKNPLRSPLDTIVGANGIEVPKQKTKKISPKNQKDPSQRTLNFFVQTPNANTPTTPSKKNSVAKTRGSPVVPELKIRLTPKSKVKEVLEKSSRKSKEDLMNEWNDREIEENLPRNLFTVDQDITEVVEKVDEVGGKIQNTIPDGDEDDFVTKKQIVKTAKANKKKTSNEDTNVSTCKKDAAKKKVDDNLKENEGVHLNKLNDIQDTLNKKVSNAKHEVIRLDDDFSEHEKKIVQKNALKKQKTLSQMFKFDTLKKPSKTKDVQQAKTAVAIDLPRDVEMVCSNKEVAKKLELPVPKIGSERMRISLPSPKAVVVPEQLRRHYGDILMITEFIHTYGDFLSQEGEVTCSPGTLNPDDLVSGLMSDGSENEDFLPVLISFLNVLLTDLRDQDSSKQFSDIGVDLLDMRVTEATVGELTRLYVQRCHSDNHLMKNKTKKAVSAQRRLSENILMDLNKKGLVNLSAVQRLEVLVYLLEHILISELFYSHYQQLDENRRQAWSEHDSYLGWVASVGLYQLMIKKLELEAEIRELFKEEKKREELKHAQKEIDTFLEKNKSGDDGGIDMVVGNEANDSVPDPEKAKEETKGNDTESNQKNEESAKNSSLTKRQEMVEKSKIEKEKQDEMRCFSEELYQRRHKIERLKEVINQAGHCRRAEALGSDRNHSRYWLFQSHPEGLFLERTVWPDQEDVVDDHLTEGERNPSQSDRWYYYTTKEEINRLLAALSFHDEKEHALKVKILKNSKKLTFKKRQTSLSTGDCAEKNSTDDLGNLKKELCDLASRITEGSMGSIEDLESWSENVLLQSSHGDLVTLAVEFASAVEVKSLSKQLGDRDQWLKEDWVPAVMDSMTSSRLRFCLAVLDCCIMWDTCTLYLKCKICRRNAGTMAVCDKCRQGFHIKCLRPALDEVPDGEWLCCVCNRGTDGHNTRRGVRKGYAEVVEEEETQEEENDDYCDVCGCEGELICCDNCPKVYHKECHDPPLRNIPRGVWKCCSCQGRRPTARKRDDHAETEEYSDLESSQEESPQDGSYSCESGSGSGSDSESSVDSESSAAIERTERAKKRELLKEEKDAKVERSSRKKKANNKKRTKKTKGNASDKDEKVQEKECRGTIKEDSSEEDEEITHAEKRPRLRKCALPNVETNQRNKENEKRSTRKRKCNSLEEEHSTAKRKPRQNSELKKCETLVKDLMHHEDSWPFIEPVDTSEVPDYLEVVASPMDFGAIRRKLNAFEYNSYENCLDDIKLVFANSDQYNVTTSDHGLAGISLEAHFKEILPNYFPKYELQKLPQKSSRLRSSKRSRRC